jgi:cytoskeletal protein CcmA (bactofilin family)
MADKRQADGELSLIGSGTTVEGKVTTEGSIRIDGTVIGDVVAKTSASIGAGGTLEGNLKARNITLSGNVKGTVVAQEKLILENRSVLQGDIRATRLVVDEGALFNGQCAMDSTSTDGGSGGEGA